MFLYALRTALRHLRRRKSYVVLNVVGLAVGMACCLLISLYVQSELAYDRFFEGAERVYRVVLDEWRPAGTTRKSVTPGYVGPALAGAFPEVERAVRVARMQMVLRRGDRQMRERAVLWADTAFFDVFSFRLLAGDPQTVLAAPYSLVLTERAARRYFGADDPLGQTLEVDAGALYTVTGVVADTPAATHVQFDVLASMSTLPAAYPDWLSAWDVESVHTYVRLAPGADAAALAAKLPAFVERRVGAAMRAADEHHTLALQPLADVHFDRERTQPLGPAASRGALALFGAVAVFILLLACANFVNLATARAAERAREVGVRKVAGAGRGRLAAGFVAEAVVLAFAALGVALVAAEASLSAFGALAGKAFAPGVLLRPGLLAAGVAGAAGVGVLAGAYPALVLSAFRPIDVLKGPFRASARGAALRRGLVVFQFGTAIALVAATLVVAAQMRYVRGHDLGFDRGPVLVLDFGGDAAVARQYEAVKAALAAHPAVEGVAAASDVPGTGRIPAATFVEDAGGELRETPMVPYMVDHDYVSVLGLDVVAGRAFERAFAGDSSRAMLLNEAAVAALGYASPADAVGKRYRQWGREGEVVGVVRDFHVRSLHEPVAPMTMRVAPVDFRFLAVRLHPEAAARDLPGVVAGLEALWKRVAPHVPFDYSFLDDRLAAQYRADERFGRVFGVFAGLAVLVACLGLFGLAAFTAAQRAKEVGIRKVLGATTAGLVALLARDAARPVALAFALAAPVACVAMDRWLERFAYRTDVPAGALVAAGLGVLAVALMAAGTQALRAAHVNPVDVLRSE